MLKSRLILPIAICVLVLAAIGGGVTWIAFQLYEAFLANNSRVMVYDNLTLLGRLSDAPAMYHALEFSMPRPGDGHAVPRVQVMVDKRILDTQSLTKDDASRMSVPSEEYNGQYEEFRGKGTRYTVCDASLVFDEEGALRILMVVPGARCVVKLRTDPAGEWVPFPLTEESAEQLFGKPKQAHSFHMN